MTRHDPSAEDEPIGSDAYDAVVVGAGPAGLTAATYLARYRRRVLVLDGGPSRAAWIPESHNTPGFPHGISGPALLARLRAQAEEFGAVIRPARAESLQRTPTGFRIAADTAIAGATVLLATGILDHLPPLAGLDTAIRSGIVRLCPICDAYEARDRRLAVLGEGDFARREAAFLRTYSPDVTVLALDETRSSAGVRPISMSDLRLDAEGVVLAPPGGEAQRFDHLYLALGCTPQAALAVSVGAQRDDQGDLMVDSHQMTTVDGLYAAGDVVRGLNQIAVGAGEAAIAATAIHNRLREAAAGEP